jgi:DNA-binding response OmpR family regulator
VEDLLEEAKKENILDSIKKPFDINQVTAFVTQEVRQSPGEKISILVIDDDQSILDFFKRLLTDKLYEVTALNSAESALETLKTRKFDLVFLDVFLGKANGIEIYSKIREIRPDAKVILISGSFEALKEDIKGLELSGCLLKPFEINKIFTEIDRVKSLKSG